MVDELVWDEEIQRYKPMPQFMKSVGYLDSTSLAEVMQQILDAPFKAQALLVHPHSHEWAHRPVGPAPSVEALHLAFALGTIDLSHPDLVALSVVYRDEPRADTTPS